MPSVFEVLRSIEQRTEAIEEHLAKNRKVALSVSGRSMPGCGAGESGRTPLVDAHAHATASTPSDLPETREGPPASHRALDRRRIERLADEFLHDEAWALDWRCRIYVAGAMAAGIFLKWWLLR